MNKPSPPDMSALALAYEQPTGTLDGETARAALEVTGDVASMVTSLGLEATLLETVFRAVDTGEADAGSDDGGAGTRPSRSTFRGEGYLIATRICNGWGPEPEPDPDNGQLRFTLGFTESGLDPVAWGDVSTCRYVVENRRITLGEPHPERAGQVRLFFGGVVPFDRLQQTRVLFDLDLLATVEDVELLLDFDFRIDRQAATLEVRVSAGDGDLIAVIEDGLFSAVRTREGRFVCDPVERACVSPQRTVEF